MAGPPFEKFGFLEKSIPYRGPYIQRASGPKKNFLGKMEQFSAKNF
jgi:hypothetical protein